jgi:hypothetical protein
MALALPRLLFAMFQASLYLAYSGVPVYFGYNYIISEWPLQKLEQDSILVNEKFRWANIALVYAVLVLL